MPLPKDALQIKHCLDRQAQYQSDRHLPRRRRHEPPALIQPGSPPGRPLAASRRAFLASGLAAFGGGWLASTGLRSAFGAGAEPDPERSAVELLTPAAQKAIDPGLALLARRQRDDGSFDSDGYRRNVAVSALAGMAFLSSGSTPDRGPYGKHVSRSVDFLLNHAQESGFIDVPDARSHGPMYGHGFATLFLAEAYERPCGTPAARAGSDGIRRFATSFARGNSRTAPGPIRSATDTAPPWHA